MNTESKPGGEEAALLRAAIAAANAGEHDTALAHLQRLVELQPQHELGCGMLGALHAQQGRGEAAAPWFERTLALNPDNVLARFQLGLLALQSGRFQDALDRWAPMLALEEDFMAHFHSAVALLQLERDGEARPLLETAGRRMPPQHPLREQLDELMKLTASEH